MARVIDAQARWVKANGDLQVALAAARQMHAKAASMEMDNSIKWVETYFERKELIRRMLHPTYRDRVSQGRQVEAHELGNLARVYL